MLTRASFVRGVRRRSILLCAIVCSTGIVTGQGIASMPEPIVIHDFSDAGVRLTPSTAPGFDERVGPLIQPWGSQAMALKPYLVILSNESKYTIVAYCVVFTTTDASGPVHQKLIHFNYPQAVAGRGSDGSGLPRGREVRTGEERVVGMNFEIMPEYDNRWLGEFAVKQNEALKEARKLEVSLDAVIFDDGRLVGDDTSELQRAFEQYLRSTEAIYRSVASRIDGGESVETAFQWLRQSLAEAIQKGPNDVGAFYYVQAAGDVGRARTRIGDGRVRDVFEQAIRKTPFVITRERPK